MTNKEAIEYLKTFRGYDLPIQEALDMAIKALDKDLAENVINIKTLEKYFHRDEWGTPDEKWWPEGEIWLLIEGILYGPSIEGGKKNE